MSRSAIVLDLIEQVEQEPNWRVVQTTGGWRIYPPDKEHAVIHVRDFRELDFIKTALRRAGFKPLLTLKEQRTMVAAVKNPPPATPTHHGLLTAMAAPTPPPPRDLIAEARERINEAVAALSALETILGEIAGERVAILQVKQLFQTIMK